MNFSVGWSRKKMDVIIRGNILSNWFVFFVNDRLVLERQPGLLGPRTGFRRINRVTDWIVFALIDIGVL